MTFTADTPINHRYFEAGGCLRDEVMNEVFGTNIKIHDLDFAVEAPSFDAMREELERMGFEIYVETPEKLTIRCKVPVGHPFRERAKDADFVLCREEGPYSDGRRPDWVKPADRVADQARRDLTINSMARDVLTGELFDPHGGRADIENRIIRFVGDDPMQRILEDGLRVARAFRFKVTTGFQFDFITKATLYSPQAAEILSRMAVERVQVELDKAFRHDTVATVRLLGDLPLWTQEALFPERLWLLPTLKER